MIGVSRRQAWKRQRDGSEQTASYRYYQCESRTNQGICSYHTHRAEELEQTVREKLAEIDPNLLASPMDDGAVIAHWQAEARRLRERLQQIDRRLGRSLEAAASGKLSREGLRADGLALAEEHMKAEDELHDAEWRAEHYASAAERRRTRGAALDIAVGQWDTLPLGEKQQFLRELIDHIEVSDDDVRVILKP
jgi:hypothetical protein